MLIKLLEQNKAFKLVTGAGNEDSKEVEELVYVYAKAGCRFFDVCADIDVLKAAKNGVVKAGLKIEEHCFCVSVGIKGDPHIRKVQIDSNACIRCGKCFEICPQSAINQYIKIEEQKCIGCGKCFEVCHKNAISFYDMEKNLKEVLPELIEEGIDCIELHANGVNEKDIFEKWTYLNDIFDGVLSLCIDRSNLSTNKLIERIEKVLECRKSFTTIVQADGNPMSGGENDYETTLESVATSKIVADAMLPVYLLISGGTNAKTMELARLCGVKANGVSLGSYARKIVKNHIEKGAFDEAISVAKTLVVANDLAC